jgi:hypothetical protein
MSRRTNNSPKALTDVMRVSDLIDLLYRLGVTERRMFNKTGDWVITTLENTHSSSEIKDAEPGILRIASHWPFE